MEQNIQNQNITFLTGLGCGLCLGISLVACRKYVGISGIFYKTTATAKPQDAATAITKKFSLDNKYRLALVVRSDLQMTKAKLATQCGHAAIMAYDQAIQKDPEGTEFWKAIGQTKIALKTDSINEIKQLEDKAKQLGVITSIVYDEGRTQVAPNTLTVLGVGPAPQDVVNQITGHLKLL